MMKVAGIVKSIAIGIICMLIAERVVGDGPMQKIREIVGERGFMAMVAIGVISQMGYGSKYIQPIRNIVGERGMKAMTVIGIYGLKGEEIKEAVSKYI